MYSQTPDQLNYSPYRVHTGRKHFDVKKNMQSSGILSEYYSAMPDQRQQIQPSYLPRQKSDLAPPIHPPASYQQPIPYQPREVQNPPVKVQPEPFNEQIYLEEIARLRAQLNQKEQELKTQVDPVQEQHFQAALPPTQEILPPPQEESSIEYYNRINKSLFDKQQLQDRIHQTSQTLDTQMSQKEKLRNFELMEKEAEQQRRLQDLMRQREENIKRRAEELQRARQYKESLDLQASLKSRIDREEIMYRRNNPPKPQENPPPPLSRSAAGSIEVDPFQRDASSFYHTEPRSSHFHRFTKKAPKTICYDPITGTLKDTSQFLHGNFQPQQIPREPSNPYLPPKNQGRIAPEYSSLPAFQQPQFTKAHPKFTPSFPITGSHFNPAQLRNDFREDVNKFYGTEEEKLEARRMADYGNMMMKPAYRY